MKFENKKLLIFDLDGTLINSALDLALAVNYMLEQLGRESFDEELIHGWVGNGALTLVKRALSGTREVDENLDEAHVEKALTIFLDYYEKNLCNATIPYPHVIETLHTLKEKGYTLAIVTNKPFAFVSPILKALGMDEMFALILGGDSLPEKKPHPQPLLHVCESLEIEVENAVMIGDSKNDILAANACCIPNLEIEIHDFASSSHPWASRKIIAEPTGATQILRKAYKYEHNTNSKNPISRFGSMDSVGVTYGYNYGEEIGVHKPSVIIDDFGELLKFL